MTDNKATLSVNGKTIEFPVYSGTMGPDVVDVRGLVKEGMFTLPANQNLPSLTAIKAYCFTRVTLSNNSRKKQIISMYATCLFSVNFPPRRSQKSSIKPCAITLWFMSNWSIFSMASEEMHTQWPL